MWAGTIGNTVYAGLDLFTEGTLLRGADAATGRPVVRRPVPIRIEQRGVDVFGEAGGVLIMAASPYTPLDTGGIPALVGVEPAAGQVRWSSTFGRPDDPGDVVVEARRCYVAIYTSVYALNPADGGRAWKVPLRQPSREVRPSLRLHGDTLLVGATGLQALDAATGRPRWTALAGEQVSRPVVLGDTVIVAAGNSVAAVSLASGRPRWRAPSPSDLMTNGATAPSHVSAAGGAVAVAFDAGLGGVTPYTPTNPGGFLVLAAADGEPRFAHRAAPGQAWRVAMSGGHLFAADGSTLYAYQAGGP